MTSRIHQFLAALVLLTGLGFAQSAPILVQIGGSNPTQCNSGTCRQNSIPFSPSFADEYCFQMAVPAAALPPASSVLTDIGFVLSTTGTLVYQECEVSIGHTSIPSISCNLAANSPDLTLQYAGPLNFVHTAGQWSSLGVPLAFSHDGVRDLLIEIRLRTHVSGSGGAVAMTEPGDGAVRTYDRTPGSFTSNTCSHGVGTVAPKIQLVFRTVSASVRSIGVGCGSPIPTLRPLGLPTIGNASFALEIAGGPAAQPSFLWLALDEANPPVTLGAGCATWLDLASLTLLLNLGVNPLGPVVTDAQGDATYPLPVPLDPGLAGQSLFLQGVVSAPGNPLGAALSNAVALEFN